MYYDQLGLDQDVSAVFEFLYPLASIADDQLFFDDDGKLYLCTSRSNDGKRQANGSYLSTYGCEIELSTGKSLTLRYCSDTIRSKTREEGSLKALISTSAMNGTICSRPKDGQGRIINAGSSEADHRSDPTNSLPRGSILSCIMRRARVRSGGLFLDDFNGTGEPTKPSGGHAYISDLNNTGIT